LSQSLAGMRNQTETLPGAEFMLRGDVNRLVSP
jgi:hypothetical protein